MSRYNPGRLVPILLGLLLVLPAALAQAPPPSAPGGEPEPEEVRAAIKQFFERRMREELALTDAQTAAMRPLVAEIEQSRSATHRERASTVRALREGLRNGAGDEELQGLLGRLDRIQDEERARERSVMARVDEQLTVRQRVQFRFFIEAFRRGMERRIREWRGERERGSPRQPPGRRLPPAEQP